MPFTRCRFLDPRVRPPPRSTLFPYTTLFRSLRVADAMRFEPGERPRRFNRRVFDGDLGVGVKITRSEEQTSELQSLRHLVCRLLLEKKKMSLQKRYRPVRSKPTP